MNICAKFSQTPVLDIGCGEDNIFINSLRKNGSTGYGMDLFPFRGIDICADAKSLPFKDGTFQTVTFIGSFNYIPDISNTLKEVKRVLNDDGVILITNTTPLFSRIRHAYAWWDKAQNKIESDAVYGFSNRQLEDILEANGFKIRERVKYLMGISSLFIAELER